MLLPGVRLTSMIGRQHDKRLVQFANLLQML